MSQSLVHYRHDYRPLPFAVDNMELFFEIIKQSVHVLTRINIRPLQDGISECVLDGSTYKWQVINTQASSTGTGGDIQSSTIPTASASEEGKIIQYTGETNSQFKKGYFYECVNDSGTYKWQPINTQEGGLLEHSLHVYECLNNIESTEINTITVQVPMDMEIIILIIIITKANIIITNSAIIHQNIIMITIRNPRKI